MRVVLEGADNSGKTTLANRLVSECPPIVYHHPGGRPADQSAELRCLTEQMALVTNHENLLMDRCTAISQQVYTPNDGLIDARCTWIEQAQKLGTLFVYCRPDTDWLMSFENFTWREGETEEFKREIVSKQHVYIDRYDALFRQVPHIHYDYRAEEASFVLKHLILGLSYNESSKILLEGAIRMPQCS